VVSISPLWAAVEGVDSRLLVLRAIPTSFVKRWPPAWGDGLRRGTWTLIAMGTLAELYQPLSAEHDAARRGRVTSFLLTSLRKAGGRYEVAIESFNSEVLKARGCPFDSLPEEDQDFTLADRVVELFERTQTAEGLAAAATLVAAMSKTHPRCSYKTAWKSLDVWRTRCPPRQAPAMPHVLAMACVSWLVGRGRPGIAAGVLLCACGLLRAAESLSLSWSALRFVSRGLLLSLGQTKRGQDQTVMLVDPSVVSWFRGFFRFSAPDPDDKVVGVSYGTFQRWLQKAAVDIGFGPVPWTTHSLRRGGASELALLGMSVVDIMEFGRWLNIRSAREYIRKGELCLTELRRDIPATAWRKARVLGAVGHQVWDNCN
jgi:hypothetical protein